MFNRLKNFSEDVAKSFNEMNEQPKVNSVAVLKQNSRALSVATPDEKDLVQPEDEPVENSESTEPNAKSPEPQEQGRITNENISLASPRSSSNTPTPRDGIDIEQLSPILRSKMKKFYKYEEKYPILLEAFKVEKRKTDLIRIFENVLKENTPISSISDADLLVDFIKGLNEKNQLLNEELKKQVNVNSALKRERKLFEEEKKKIEDERDSYKMSLADSSELDKLKLENKELITKIDLLKEQNTQLDNLKAEKQDLENLLDTVGKELDTAKQQVLEFEYIKNQLEEKTKEMEEFRLNSDKSKVTDAKSTKRGKNKRKALESQQKTSKPQQQEVTVKDTAFEELKVNYDKLKAEMTSKSEDVENLRDLLRDLGNDLTGAKEKIKQQEQKIEEYENEVEKLQQSQIQASNPSIETSLKLEIASLKSSIEHKEQQITELKSQINKLQEVEKIKETLELHNKQLLSDKLELSKTQEFQSNKINALSDELVKVTAESLKLNESCSTLKTQLDIVEKAKRETSHEFQLVKQQYDDLLVKSRENRNKIDSLTDELGEKQKILNDRTKETSSIKKILLDNQQNMKKVEAEFNEKVLKIEQEKTNIENEIYSLNKKKQRELDELKSIAENYLSKLTDLEDKYNSVKNQPVPVNTHEDNTELIETLRTSLAESINKISELQQVNDVLKKLNDENNLKFEKLSKNYKLLTQQYKLLESTQTHNNLQVKEKEITSKSPNMDYLKNVLLGFFEHKDQREQLLPVLKTLFEFNRDEERKLLVALK